MVFIEFVTILLLFYILVFWPPVACGILAPQPGIEPAWLGDTLWVAGPPQIHGSHPAFKWSEPQGPV